MLNQQKREVATETRIGTRVMLRKMTGIKCDIDQLDGVKLHSEEVATYIVKNTRNMWLAAQSAGLPEVAKKLELVFIDAFTKTKIRYDLDMLKAQQSKVN